MPACTGVQMCVCIGVNERALTCAQMWTCRNACACEHACVCVCVCVCSEMCVHSCAMGSTFALGRGREMQLGGVGWDEMG